MRIAVVGSRGQLGAAVVHVCAVSHEVVALDRSALDVTDAAAVADVIGRIRPEAIVNCSGYNAVDAAESHPVEAMQVNAFAVRSLARAATTASAAFVQFSSDFVFDGLASEPMSEEHPPNPRSAYSTSKLLGEWFAADAPRWYVLRVESLFGAAPGRPAKGSLESIVRGLIEGETVRVFSDRIVTPTHVGDAAEATLKLLEHRLTPGIYHCVNSGWGTWLEIATEAARLLDVEPRFQIVKVADVKLPAQRPRYCAMSNAKLAAAGIPMPTWQDALARHLAARRSRSGSSRT
jgi:dTDP-4-dehydrorhamnose reductase